MNQIDKFILYIYRFTVCVLAAVVIYLWTIYDLGPRTSIQYNNTIIALIATLVMGALHTKPVENKKLISTVIQFGSISILTLMLLLGLS